MTGFTNYSADNIGNYLTGQTAMPALPAVYLALFTAVGSDVGILARGAEALAAKFKS